MSGDSGGLVGGRFRLVEPVGQGAMGRVWRGRDEVLDREVAVKEILLPHGVSGELRDMLIRRVLREARAAARLNHPGIVTVHDVVEHDGAPVIVMEFLTGTSLGAEIERLGRLPVERVAAIGAVMLEALGQAHAAGVVHRDLKPDNVLLAGKRVVITDFGIAGMADATALTASGMVMGTPRYMAPEQIEGHPAPASDLWSLGATLYTAVEGEPPFNGPTLTSLYAAILTQQPRPTQHAGPLSPALESLLVKDPTRRATAEDIERALAQVRAALHRPPASPAPSAPTVVPPVSTTVGLDTTPGSTAVPPGSAPIPLTVVEPTQPPDRHWPGRRIVLLGGLGALAAGISATVAFWPEPSRPTGTAARQTTRTAYETLTGHTDYVFSVAFSPDGKTLATGSGDNTARLWEVATGRTTATLTGHDSQVGSVAFSPDGKTLATGSGDSTARLWEVATGRATATLVNSQPVSSVAFSPDGKTLATGSYDSTARLWEVATGRATATLTGHTGMVSSVAFSPDGKTLATGSYDSTARLWEVATGRATATLTGHTGYVNSVAFSPDGKTLATGSNDKTARLWDVATGRTTATLTGSHTGMVHSVAFSPDGKTLATGSNDKTARLWDVATGRTTATLTGHTGMVSSVAFSPDGKTLATGSHDSTARLWGVA